MSEPDLVEVAARFRAALPPGRLDVFRIDPLDRLGIPVVQATFIAADDPSPYTGFGYGMSEVEAEVGAVAELCEEVYIGRAVAAAPRVAGSYAGLCAERGMDSVLDPLTLSLPAGSSYSPKDELDWIEVKRLRDGAPVLCPIEWLAAYPNQLPAGRPRLITAITNGLGAGSSLPMALVHGLLELHQRDGNVVSFRALDRGVVIESDVVGDRTCLDLLERLAAGGIKPKIKLASTDWGMTNLYVVGDDPTGLPQPICVTACGEAVHPDRERALRKALLEFVGSRSRKVATHGPVDVVASVAPGRFVDANLAAADLDHEEPRALHAMMDWLGRDADDLRRLLAGTVLSEQRRVSLSSLPTVAAASVADAADRLAVVAGRLAAEGLDVFFLDATPDPNGWLKVVKTVVPGLESETMSYHRIGERGVRRLAERSDPLLLSEPREGAARIRLTAEAEVRVGGPKWFDARLANAIVGRMYPLYREPGNFAARLAMQKESA